MAKRFGKRDRDSSTGASIFRGHSRPVYAVSFSQDGQLLLSASGDGTVRLWSTELSANLVAYRSALTCVALVLHQSCYFLVLKGSLQIHFAADS